jgi:cytoskeletal protein CcmA (bactofilin family)
MTQTTDSPVITGHGEIPGGRYRSVTITGQGRVSGDVAAESVVVQGSATIAGSVTTGTLEVSGELHIAGHVQAERANLDGFAHVQGDLRSQQVVLTGAHTVSGDVLATDIEAHGQLTVNGAVEADRVVLEIAGDCRLGSVRAHAVQVRPAPTQGQTQITLRRGRAVTRIRTSGELPGGEERKLTAGTITGEDVHLELTSAQRVTAARVTIGPGCTIATVEYGESLQVDPGATVARSSKTQTE